LDHDGDHRRCPELLVRKRTRDERERVRREDEALVPGRGGRGRRDRERFAEPIALALGGGLDDWAETLRGRLALVLLLDQMTRSVFRGTARAFAGDARAQQLATATLQAGTASALDFEHRHFLYMPLLHAEDAALLDLFNAIFPQALARVPDWARPLLSDGLEQGAKYRDVFARFGRFPHRNEALGRRSTFAEVEFLATWEARRRPKAFKALVG
jgi:uncharacterized protein (DUF924 family)